MKTTKTFNIYCDESTHLPHDRHPYMVLGYVSIAYNQMDMAKAQIKENEMNLENNYNVYLKKKGRNIAFST